MLQVHCTGVAEEVLHLVWGLSGLRHAAGALLLVCRTGSAEDTSDTQSNASGSTQMPDSPRSGLDAST